MLVNNCPANPTIAKRAIVQRAWDALNGGGKRPESSSLGRDVIVEHDLGILPKAKKALLQHEKAKNMVD